MATTGEGEASGGDGSGGPASKRQRGEKSKRKGHNRRWNAARGR